MPGRPVTLLWIARELGRLAVIAFSLGAAVKFAAIVILGAAS